MVDDGGWHEDDEPATTEDARADGQGHIDPGSDGPGEEEGAVAGSFSPDVEVRPGTPGVENVVFVALGVYVAILALGQMIAGSAIYAPATLGAITLGVAAGTALLYGFFVRTDS